MVRTIIHGARIGGGGVQMGFSIYRYQISILLGGGAKVDRGCWFYRHAVTFFW